MIHVQVLIAPLCFTNTFLLTDFYYIYSERKLVKHHNTCTSICDVCICNIRVNVKTRDICCTFIFFLMTSISFISHEIAFFLQGNKIFRQVPFEVCSKQPGCLFDFDLCILMYVYVPWLNILNGNIN